MDINELRKEIDALDDKILALYMQRMELCADIAEYKAKNEKSVSDFSRENAILFRLAKTVPAEMQVYVKELYGAIFATSKAYQSSLINRNSPTVKEIKDVLMEGSVEFPVVASAACQGVEGSNAERAARKIFQVGDVSYFRDFASVFNAVDKGFCEYGILPVENSTSGSVLEVYDLMKKYDFRIVRSLKLRIDHCLACVKGSDIKKIEKVISHPQALRQCGKFIAERSLQTISAENTATAARDLSESGDQTTAVICSADCAEKYGLVVLDRAIQDHKDNYTRFICIAKKLQIFRGSEKISLVTSLPHEAGSLSKILSEFSAHNLNLTKIESRPISSDFEFLFYFDFEGDVTSKSVQNLIARLELGSDKFKFLGCYKEIV
ncbi:MAG: chorismate mutase [Clostridia bacterium]|nr:chorismate mutase [Clostridia bacterium]